MTDENDKDELYGHRDDSRKMSFWIKKTLYDKWDAFCKENSIRKTTLITVAVNEWIRLHSIEGKDNGRLATVEAKIDTVSEKLNTVTEKIAEEQKGKAIVQDQGVRDQILQLLELSPLMDKRIAGILHLPRDTTLDVLASMKKDKLVRQNKKGDWFILDQE
ncbi:MAG: hypothetical protein Q6373_025545 [Candidatus Sigynarchaeota archaeon]